MNHLTLGYFLFGISFFIFLLVSWFPFHKRVRLLSFLAFATLGIVTLFNHIVWELTGCGFNQSIPYHLRFGMEGVGLSEFYKLIVLTLICLLFLLTAFFLYRKFLLRNENQRTFYYATILMQCFLLGMHPLWGEIYETYKERTISPIPFEAHYHFPDSLSTLSSYPNIVWIYAESMERSYLNDSLFPGLMPYLKNLESQSLSFTNVQQVYGTSWTIAGIVSSQNGIPLVTMGLNGNELNKMKTFLPGVKGISELLSDKNYQVEFMQGSSGWFAGSDKYFETHQFKFTDLDDIQERLKIKETEGWGINDDLLFQLGIQRYQELQKTKRPFAFMLSTIDTHHPDGRIPQACGTKRYQNGENSILNAVHCSDSLIVDFVTTLRKLDTTNSTLIVISSDHLAMPNTAYELLKKGTRRNLLLYNWPGRIHPSKINTPACSFDEGATALNLMGFKNTKLGLGRSLVSDDKTFIQTFPKNPDEQLKGWEYKFNEFWSKVAFQK